MENRDYFIEAGGTRYEYIHCLNAEPGHVAALTDLLADQMQGWLTNEYDPAMSDRLARNLGAPH